MTPFLEMKERAEKLQKQVDALMIERFKENPRTSDYTDLAFKLRRNNPGSISHEIAAIHLEDAADVIKKLDLRIERLEKALENLIDYSCKGVCTHEETYRGGVLWEVCKQCGAKWADDEGGKSRFQWPKEILEAKDTLDGK